jgi:hypothetical protein
MLKINQHFVASSWLFILYHHGNVKSGNTELSTCHVREWSSEIQAENENVSTERIEVCRSASSWNFRTRLYELSGSTNHVPTYWLWASGALWSVLLLVKFCNSFYARSQSCKTRLLAPSCLSVRALVYLSVRTNNSAPTRRIFVKFHIRQFFENVSSKFKFH